MVQGYVLIGSTYLILKTEGELQETHYRTATIAAFTTLIGALLITITTPIFSEALRVNLLDSSPTAVFFAIPLLAIALIALLLRSLSAKSENTPFIVPDTLVETMHFQCKALASPFRLFIPATLEPVR